MYQKKGRRGRNIIMPIDYKKVSPYVIKKVEIEKCFVKCRWNGEQKTIRIPRNSTPYVDLEHSTIRAKLRVECHDFCKGLHTVFSKENDKDIIDESITVGPKRRNRILGPKRRRLPMKTSSKLMLEDTRYPLPSTTSPKKSSKRSADDEDMLAQQFEEENIDLFTPSVQSNNNKSDDNNMPLNSNVANSSDAVGQCKKVNGAPLIICKNKYSSFSN